MEKTDKVEDNEKDGSKDDSLADFKSPKSESKIRMINNVKILNDKRAKKSSSDGKTSKKSRKKEKIVASRTKNDEKIQPSIESSLFRASNIGNKDGHTCPLCMKYFLDTNAGMAHSKNCAAKNNVSTRKLLAAVALQERQGDERLALGLPAGPFVKPKEKTVKKYREPASKADPDLQLALALSKSLQENELEQELEEALLLATEHRSDEPIIEMTASQRRQTLKNFGFSTNKPLVPGISEGPVKSRRKKHLGPTILQTRTQESRDRLLTEKIAEILMGNEAITQVSQEIDSNQSKKTKFVLRSRLLKKMYQPTKRLWNSAQLSTETINFYVDDLRSTFLPVVDGKQENSVNDITEPGDSGTNRSNEDSPRVLNENPREFDENSKEISNSSNNTKEDEKNSLKNIYVTDRQYRNTLTLDWSNILNVSSLSDIVVVVKNNYIWAHKLVFHVRCSDILLEREPNEDPKYYHVKEKVCWSDVDFLTGLAFLEFVYSGIIEKNSHIFDYNRMAAGVRRLARKYRLKDLFDYLRKRKKEIAINDDIECRKDGLSAPIVIDVNDMKNLPNDKIEKIYNENDKIEKIYIEDKIEINHIAYDDNEKKYTENDKIEINDIIENIEENHTRDDIVLENHTTNDIIQENQIIDNDIQENHIQNDKLDMSVEKINDDGEIEMLDVISISSGRKSGTMSPDLFDETMQQSKKMDEDIKNSEDSFTEKTEILTVDNSNLNVLAQLIADDDSSLSQSSQEFTPPISVQNKIENKISPVFPLSKPIEDGTSDEISENFPVLKSIDDKNKTLKNNEKNNIEKSPVEKNQNYENFSQSHLETPKSRGRINDKLEIDEFSKSQHLMQKQKSKLSIFIEKVQEINLKPALDSYIEDETFAGPIDRRRFRNPFNVNNMSNRSIENFDEEKNSESPKEANEILRDKDLQTVDEKNNDTLNNESTKFNENSSTILEQNDEFSLINDTTLTDDENLSMYSKYKKNSDRNNSIANYRNILKNINRVSEETINNDKNENEEITNEIAIDLTQESDDDTHMNCSSSVRPRSLQKCINRILDTDSNDSSPINDHCHVESNKMIENDDLNVFENCVQDEDSDSSINLSLVHKRKSKKNKIKRISGSNEDLNKNIGELMKNSKNSLDFPDLDVFQVEEEICLQKNSNLSFSAHQSIEVRSIDNSEKNKKIEDHLTMGNSDGTKSLRNSLDFPDSHFFQLDEEIFAESLKNSNKFQCKSLSPSSPVSSQRFKSPSVKRKSDEIICKDSRLENSLIKNKRQKFMDKSSQRMESPKSSPEYPYLHLSLPTEEIFTQNLKDSDNSPRRNSGTSDREFSPGGRNSKSSPDFPEIDFNEKNDEIFTQSSKNSDEPYKAITPSSSQEMLRSQSPILITLSPELDDNFEKKNTSNEQDSNKENSIERNEDFVNSRQIRGHFSEKFSALCHEELQNPQPSTSYQKCSSRYDHDSSNSVKKFMSRSISMPESSCNTENNRKKTRTMKKTSKLTMSQQLTPPINYDTMDTPELKRELEKYGIKPLKRKRARQLLTHIYNELHPKVSITSSKTNLTNNVLEESDDEEPPAKKIGKISNHNSNDVESESDASLSQESITSQTSIIPEEMELPDMDTSPKECAGPISIKEAFTKLINADKDLYRKVLTYEPLPFEILHLTLKEQGLKCKQNDLINFLDEECITFQLVSQLGKSRTKRVRGKKNTKRKDKSKPPADPV